MSLLQSEIDTVVFTFIILVVLLLLLLIKLYSLHFVLKKNILNIEVVNPLGQFEAVQRNTTFFIGLIRKKEKPMNIIIPYPDRIRSIPRNFAWLDRRLRDRQFLGILTLKELAVYLFFVLAANKHGVSFYRSEKIAQYFDYQIHPPEIIACRNSLIKKQLIAFTPFPGYTTDEGFHQILNIPTSSKYSYLPKSKPGMKTIGEIINTLTNNTTRNY